MKAPIRLVCLFVTLLALLSLLCSYFFTIINNSDAETNRTIFFIETLIDKYDLTSREACAIESAANKHKSTVTVYNTNGPFNISNKYIQLLNTLPNVHLEVLNVAEAFRETPLESWYQSDALQSSKYPTVHTSDALRIALVYKTGGIYLDTDNVVVRSLDKFRNTIGDQGFNKLGSSVLIFDKHSEIIHEYMTQFANDFRGELWDHQGPVMLDKLVKKRCNVTKLNEIYDQPHKCGGITVKPQNVFLLLKFTDFFVYLFDVPLDYSDTYIVHIYGTLSRNTKAEKESFLEKLFRRHCPLSYQLMPNDDFY
ncbi:Lactosylceramide 4-alpha-galactosyltransferase [Chamberlinius hualienensis]